MSPSSGNNYSTKLKDRIVKRLNNEGYSKFLKGISDDLDQILPKTIRLLF